VTEGLSGVKTDLAQAEKTMVGEFDDKVQNLISTGQEAGSEFHSNILSGQARLEKEANSVRVIQENLDNSRIEVSDSLSTLSKDISSISDQSMKIKQDADSDLNNVLESIDSKTKSAVLDLRNLVAPIVDGASKNISALLDEVLDVESSGEIKSTEYFDSVSEDLDKVVDAIEKLFSSVEFLEMNTLTDLKRTNANHSTSMNWLVHYPVIELLGAVRELGSSVLQNTSSLESLVAEVARSSEGVMKGAWGAVQQAEALASAQAREAAGEAEFELNAASKSSASNVALLHQEVANGAMLISGLKEGLEKAQEGSELETIAANVANVRAQMASLMSAARNHLNL
jgi:hypothetical protein